MSTAQIPTTTDTHPMIEECISLCRTRIAYGVSREEIIRDLGRLFPADVIFFSFQGAILLEKWARPVREEKQTVRKLKTVRP